MKRTKRKVFILTILLVALNVAAVLGISLGRYTDAWKHGFGVVISPTVQENILAPNSKGDLFNPDTEHIIFGKTEDYAAVAASLSETKKEVGSEIWSYYDKTNKITYVLCDSTIYLNPDSSQLFAKMTSLKTVTYDNYSTEKVTNMSEMFRDCSALTTVYADENFNTENVVDSEGVDADADMFTGCFNLVGGNGTRVYPEGSDTTDMPLGKENALVDGLDNRSGYFTGPVYYFLSNELSSSSPSYIVNGTTAWFTVANALNSTTYANAPVVYTLSWSVSEDGMAWTSYKTESDVLLPGNGRVVEKYGFGPIEENGTVYNWVKVQAFTASFTQDDIEAVYQFDYNDHDVEVSYDGGVITVTLNTNNFDGDFEFSWLKGITPDNSDPTGLFKDAAVGPADITVKLKKNTEYEFLFFVTDSELIQALKDGSSHAEEAVTVKKK